MFSIIQNVFTYAQTRSFVYSLLLFSTVLHLISNPVKHPLFRLVSRVDIKNVSAAVGCSREKDNIERARNLSKVGDKMYVEYQKARSLKLKCLNNYTIVQTTLRYNG